MSKDLFETNEDSLIINMDAVEAQSFELIPAGTYDCIIESCEFGFGKDSGKPMWTVVVAIVEGAYSNRKLFTWMSFSEAAIGGTKATLQRIAPEVLSNAFDPKKIAAEGTLVGKRVRAKVKVEKYKDEDRSSVKGLLAPAGGSDDFMGA